MSTCAGARVAIGDDGLLAGVDVRLAAGDPLDEAVLRSYAIAAVHMYNHGTHHRGQLTTLLKQAGIDPGVTDLPWVPGIVQIVD